MLCVEMGCWRASTKRCRSNAVGLKQQEARNHSIATPSRCSLALSIDVFEFRQLGSRDQRETKSGSPDPPDSPFSVGLSLTLEVCREVVESVKSP